MVHNCIIMNHLAKKALWKAKNAKKGDLLPLLKLSKGAVCVSALTPYYIYGMVDTNPLSFLLSNVIWR